MKACTRLLDGCDIVVAAAVVMLGLMLLVLSIAETLG